MKKFLVLMLALLTMLSFVACSLWQDEETPAGAFEKFETALDQTPASKVTVETKMTSELGTLNSKIATVFNPDGSAKINYTIENFNENFDTDSIKTTKTGELTLNANGSYSDGGEFVGSLGTAVANVNLNLIEEKLGDYKADGNVLTATVKEADTAAVFGTAIGADVSFALTISNNRVISVTMNYEIALGAVEVVCSYN